MVKIGIDLGKFKSDVCVMSGPNEVVERFRVDTTPEALQRAFGNRPACEIGIEAGRDAGWIHQLLTGLGHQVKVMDTTQARSAGVGRGRRKTNRLDAQAIARALFSGIFPEAHVLSPFAARLRDLLLMRRQLVRMRSGLVTTLRGQFQAQGWRAPKCEAKDFAKRLRATQHELVASVHVQAALRVFDQVNLEIGVLETQLRGLAARLLVQQKLCTAPGTKLIVSMTFIAVVDTPHRFEDGHKVGRYLGLVTSESSTGEGRRLGHISKTGNSEARAMLIQAAWTAMRTRKHQEDPIILWAKQVAERRGKRIAVVGLARRLAGVLWAMWRDDTVYDPKHVARESAKGLAQRARQAQANANRMKTAA